MNFRNLSIIFLQKIKLKLNATVKKFNFYFFYFYSHKTLSNHFYNLKNVLSIND